MFGHHRAKPETILTEGGDLVARRGNILALIQWAYQVEFAGVRRVSDVILSGNGSLSGAIGRTLELRTLIDKPSIGAMAKARDTHTDAELVASVIEAKLYGRERLNMVRFGRGEWEPMWTGIEVSTSRVGPASPNPHLGKTYSWPRTVRNDGRGQTGKGFASNKSIIASLHFIAPYSQQRDACADCIRWVIAVERVRRDMVRRAARGELASWRLDPTPTNPEWLPEAVKDLETLRKLAGDA